MSSEPVMPEPEEPVGPPEPQPVVYKCARCGEQPVMLIGAKWRHPPGSTNEGQHVVNPYAA